MRNKKLIFVLFFLLIFTVVPFVTSDPSFNVYNPKRDQVLTVGNNEITWNPPNNVSHVRIELHKGYNRIVALDTWVDNTGSFIWTIDVDDIYKYGKDYRIKVVSGIGDDMYGWSEYFTIDLDLNQNIINFISFVIIIILLIMILIYYNKKTHKIQNKIKEIIRKIKKRRKRNDKK